MKNIFFGVAILAFVATGCTRGPNGLPVIKTRKPVHTQPIANNPRVTTATTVTQPIIKRAKQATVKYTTPVSKPITKKPKSKKPKKISRQLKPEPYSIGSGEKDPELLGPQTTMSRQPKIINKKTSPVPQIEETDLTKKNKKAKTKKPTTQVKKIKPTIDSAMKKKVSTPKKEPVPKNKITTKKEPAPKAKVVTKQEPVPTPKVEIKQEPVPTPKVEIKQEPVLTKKVATKKEPASIVKEAEEKKSTTMSKAECIKMIGDSKFKDYTDKFGGESAAVRRCAIIKKLMHK